MNQQITVEDRLAIHELLARYAWSFGTGDVDGFVGCFTYDASLIEDTFEEPDAYHGAEAIRGMAEFFFSRPGFPGRQHHVSHILVEAEDGGASVRSFCFVTDGKGEPPYTIRFTGHYLDRVVKINGQWRFRERLIRDWSGPVLARFPGESGERVGRQRPADLERTPTRG